MSLTDTAIKAIKPTGKAQKIADGRGLFLFVTPQGGKSWRMGYARGTMTVHGFRSMASTLLNEQGFRADIIEMRLAHVEQNAVRAAYNHAEYLEERGNMMQRWACYLDSLREEASRRVVGHTDITTTSPSI